MNILKTLTAAALVAAASVSAHAQSPIYVIPSNPDPFQEAVGRMFDDVQREKQRQHELQMQQQELRMRELELQAQRAQQQQSYREAYEQGRVAAAQEAITAFRTARGANGQLLHPHYDAVEGTMTRLAQQDRAAGPMVTPAGLPQLYDRAGCIQLNLCGPAADPVRHTRKGKKG